MADEICLPFSSILMLLLLIYATQRTTGNHINCSDVQMLSALIWSELFALQITANLLQANLWTGGFNLYLYIPYFNVFIYVYIWIVGENIKPEKIIGSESGEDREETQWRRNLGLAFEWKGGCFLLTCLFA